MVKPKDPQDRPAEDEDKTVLAATADQTVIAGAMETGALPSLPEGNEDTTLLAQQAPPASPGLYTAAELPTRAVGDDRTEVNTHPGASPLGGDQIPRRGV
jgi:hypothetical protein